MPVWARTFYIGKIVEFKQEEKKARALFLFMFWTTLGGPDGEIISQRTAMSRLGKIGLPTGHIMREKSKGWQSRKHKI